jgi:16S rRNA (cytidine1402-2'-O)-methyltransferase
MTKSTSPGQPPILDIVGTPLDEQAPLSARASQRLREAVLLVGESRKVAMRYVSQVEGCREKPIFLLDPPRPAEMTALYEALESLSRQGGSAALFSDCGMPILFDPGAEVLQRCRKLGFRIRSNGTETSWGTACALSGFDLPFLIAGFPPREAAERMKTLSLWSRQSAACVLMDTPYRFRALVQHACETFSPTREAFLAWELAKETESLWWGRIGELEPVAQRNGWDKGEFVLILRGKAEHREPPGKHRQR